MSVRNLSVLAIVFLCLAACEKSDRQKKDDFIINRRDRVIVRYDGDQRNDFVAECPDDGTFPETFAASVSDGILSVSLMDMGTYELRIENSSREVVYSSQLPADGKTYEFDVSSVKGEDMYVLILTGEKWVIQWYF